MSKQNSFICTSHGFIKSVDKVIDNINNKQFVNVEYTDKLFESMRFSTKEANILFEKYSIEGFLYSPLKEYEVRPKEVRYEVKLTDYFDDEYHNFKIYEPIRTWNKINESDIDFLNNKFKKNEETYNLLTYEDAVKKCKELNALILEKVINKLL